MAEIESMIEHIVVGLFIQQLRFNTT
jgi:hypothetical protein